MNIDSETKRRRLKVRREPYWVKLQAGGYLGFRRTEGSGTWVARWRDEVGRQRYRAMRLPQVPADRAFDEASAQARAWFAQAQEGAVGRIKVRDAAARYLESLRVRRGDAAVADAKGRIDRCVNPILGERYLDTIRTRDIEDWLNGQVPAGKGEEETRRAKDSANRNLTTLKALLNAARRAGLVGSNAAWSRVRAFEKVARARTVYLTPDHRKRLLEHCTGGFRDLVEVALLTGARYGELRALLVSDFDPGASMLNIRIGKTGARDVPLSDAACRLFKRLVKDKLPGAYLLTRDDGAPWAHSDQDELMREAVKRARLPQGTVFYTLRHTFIANALTGGVDVHAVSKVCGTSMAMIQKHYGKLIPTDVREKLNKVSFA